MFRTIFALFFALLLGYSLTYLPYKIIPFRWEIWAGISVACAAGIVICLYLSRPKKIPIHQLRAEFTRFQNEFKLALRGHLKVSILFWIHFYKKEKVKTFEDAKKEVFQDLKKEFVHLRWMESLLEDIRQEISKYK